MLFLALSYCLFLAFLFSTSFSFIVFLCSTLPHSGLFNAVNLPSGVAVEVVHEEDEYSEFYFLIGTAFILIFMILASVYESFVSPFVILFSIPLAAIGSMLGLIFTGNSLFNLNTLIGFLILLGIVVNNGIILLDYSRTLRFKQGMSHARSLIEAGISRVTGG